MGLEFLKGVNDAEGVAVYIIHDGSGYQERRVTDYSNELKESLKKDVAVFSLEEQGGAQLADFYNILAEKLPAILIIRDNDEIVYGWYGADFPKVDEVVFAANQVSA
ncbi:MAG: hypothetical protein U0451_02640 [Candidatus Saccharimonadales bacterium]